jgi:F-type H+-transporting ATPase subunit delta
MATLNSIARPYAQAANATALAKKELPQWESMLRIAAEAVQEPLVSKALSNSRISPQQWNALLGDILASSLNDNRKNFLRLLTENRRLSALPMILELFKEYEARDNQASEVEVTTAVPLEKNYLQKLTDKLTQVLKHPVSLRCLVDENILGGAIVRAGDKVIDGSIRGQLTRLLEFAIR